MYTFIPRSLCALKRVTGRAEHAKFGATTGIRLTVKKGLWKAEATDGRRAIIAQGTEPLLAPPADEIPWPGFRDTPDDAYEVVIPPADLERACKVAEAAAKAYPRLSRVQDIGVATVGNNVMLGLGNDVIGTPSIEGRFPNLTQVIPTTKPIVTLRVDPRLLAETLLAIADLLSDEDKGVQLFFYGKDTPFGICARNSETGVMIDGLVVPLVVEPKKAENPPPKPVNPPPVQPTKAAPKPEEKAAPKPKPEEKAKKVA